MSKKRAFTLIELLVVVSIIALLVSILMPALSKAKGQAESTVCLTRLKSMQFAMMFYWEDNRGKLIPYGGNLWLDYIAPYTDGIDELRFCPQADRAYPATGSVWGTSKTPWHWSNTQTDGYGSYGFNGWLFGGLNRWVPSYLADHVYNSVGGIKRQEETPVFADCNWVDSWPQNNNLVRSDLDLSKGDRTGGTSQYAMGRFLVDRHGRKINVAFVSGRVQTVIMEDLWTLYWHKISVPTFDVIIP